MFSGTKEYRTKPPVGVMLNPQHPLSRGLVGCWLFNEGAGSRANDISGHGNHGTLKNMAPNAQGSGWGGSKFGGELKFDGGNDFVDCGLAPSTDLGNAITLETWVKRTGDGSSSFPSIITKRADVNNAYSLRYRPTLNVAQLFIGTGVEYKIISTNGDLVIDVWHHLVGTWDGASMLLYLDGVLQADTIPASGTPDTSGANLWIGKFDTGTIYPFQGSIDHVRIYNRVLSAEEVKQLYHDPFCNLLRVPVRYVPAAIGLSIPVAMNYYRRRRIA